MTACSSSGTFPLRAVRLEAKGQWQRHWLAEGWKATPLRPRRVSTCCSNTTSLDLLGNRAAGARVERARSALRATSRRAPPAETSHWCPTLRRRGGGVRGRAVDPGRAVERAGRGAPRPPARRRRLRPNWAIGDQRRNYTAGWGDLGLVFRPVAAVALGTAWAGHGARRRSSSCSPTARIRRGALRDPAIRFGAERAGLNVDVSARWQADRVRGEVAAFSNTIDHYIYIAPTGATRSRYRVYGVGQTNARLVGGEASLEVAAWSALALSARVDYVRGERRSDGQPLPQVPPLRVKLGAEWHRGGAGAGLDVDLVGRQTRLSPFDQGTAGYGLLDLFGNLDPRLGDGCCTWSCRSRTRSTPATATS